MCWTVHRSIHQFFLVFVDFSRHFQSGLISSVMASNSLKKTKKKKKTYKMPTLFPCIPSRFYLLLPLPLLFLLLFLLLLFLASSSFHSKFQKSHSKTERRESQQCLNILHFFTHNSNISVPFIPNVTFWLIFERNVFLRQSQEKKHDH